MKKPLFPLTQDQVAFVAECMFTGCAEAFRSRGGAQSAVFSIGAIGTMKSSLAALGVEVCYDQDKTDRALRAADAAIAGLPMPLQPPEIREAAETFAKVLYDA